MYRYNGYTDLSITAIYKTALSATKFKIVIGIQYKKSSKRYCFNAVADIVCTYVYTVHCIMYITQGCGSGSAVIFPLGSGSRRDLEGCFLYF